MQQVWQSVVDAPLLVELFVDARVDAEPALGDGRLGVEDPGQALGGRAQLLRHGAAQAPQDL